LSRFILTIIIFAVTAGQVSASLDSDRLHRLSGLYFPVFWDNIENREGLVSDAKPKFDLKLGMHLLTLHSGKQIMISVPAKESVKLFFPKGIPANGLETSVSSGLGLHEIVQGTKDEDGKSLTINPGLWRPGICKIAFKNSVYPSIRMAIFISRRHYPNTAAPYRHKLDLPLEKVKVCFGNGRKKTFFNLPPGKEVTARVKGPCRVALLSRALYPYESGERHFSYHIYYRLDKSEPVCLELETLPETSSKFTVNGKLTVAGRSAYSYFDIPEGEHLLSLKSTAHVLIRPSCRTKHDYLFPELNGWNIKGNAHRITDLKKQEERIVSKIRNPQYRQDQLIGITAMHMWADRRLDAPELKDAAVELENLHTYYKDLFPAVKPADMEIKFRWFFSPSIKNRVARDLFIGANHAKSMMETVPGGFFIQIPALVDMPFNNDQAPEHAMTFKLPQRVSFTRLQIAAMRPEEASCFQIQVANKIHKFRLEPRPDMPEESFDLTLGEAGLFTATLNDPQNRGPLGGVFDAVRHAAPITRATTYEIRIPPSAKEIRVWETGDKPKGVKLALRLSVAKPPTLTESAFYDLMELDPEASSLFEKLISLFKTNADGLNDIDDPYTGGVRKYWSPLIRFVRARNAFFTNDICPWQKQTPLGEIPPDTDKKISVLINKGTAALDRDDRLTALETWGKIHSMADGAMITRARLMISGILMDMSKFRLGEKALKSLMIYQHTTEKNHGAKTAFEALKRHYNKTEDIDRLIALYATKLICDPSPQDLAELSKELLNKGFHRYALLAALAVPERLRPYEVMIRSTIALGWNRMSFELIQSCPDDEKKEFWMAMASMKRLDVSMARKFLVKAGKSAGGWLKAIDLGLEIRRKLAHPETREKGFVMWQSWQKKHPGPRVFKADPGAIIDFAGSGNIYNLPMDLYTQMFLALEERPVRMRVAGPVRIRINGRILHKNNFETPSNGWMRLSIKGREYLYPIVSSRPISGMQWSCSEIEGRPGIKVKEVFSLGPGIHDIAVDAGSFPLLVRVERERPDIPIPVLPMLTPDTQRWLPRGIKPDIQQDRRKVGNHLIVIPVDKNGDSMEFSADLVRKTASWQSTVPNFYDLNVEGAKNPILSGGIPSPDKMVLDKDGLKKIETWVEKAKTADPEEVIAAVTVMARLAMLRPNQRGQLLSIAEAVVNQRKDIPRLSCLISMFPNRLKWQSVSSIISSAGSQLVPSRGNMPETPSQRVYHALPRSSMIQGRIVPGDKKLVMVVENIRRTVLGLTFGFGDLPFVKPLPVHVRYRIDSKPAATIVLDSDKPVRRVNLSLIKGEHRITVEIAGSYAGQYLTVMAEANRKLRFTGQWGKNGDFAMKERLYLVGTRKNPVKAYLSGPAWIRIDELVNDEIRTSYKYIPISGSRIELMPDSGKNKGTYGIYIKTMTDQTYVRPQRPIELVFDRVETPPKENISNSGTKIRVGESVQPGGHEDGTWEAAIAYMTRRNFDESEADKKLEHFWEEEIIHRYAYKKRLIFIKSSLLERVRQSGGSVTGIKGDLMLGRNKWRFGISSSYYLQYPDSSGLHASGKNQWALKTSAKISNRLSLYENATHTPSMTIFGRKLSMKGYGGYSPHKVDRDIFTLYKNDHVRGIRISDSIVYRPWVDTLFFAKTYVGTNEDMNPFSPDYFGLGLIFRQSFSDFQTSAGYRAYQYFKDRDRDSNPWRNYLVCSLSWKNWTRMWRRIGIDIDLKYDPSDHVCEGAIRFSFVWGRARGTCDFMPAEIPFRDIVNHRLLELEQ